MAQNGNKPKVVRKPKTPHDRMLHINGFAPYGKGENHLIIPEPMPTQLPIRFEVYNPKETPEMEEQIRNAARSHAIKIFEIPLERWYTVRSKMIDNEFVEVYITGVVNG